jgi:hypothetical protein
VILVRQPKLSVRLKLNIFHAYSKKMPPTMLARDRRTNTNPRSFGCLSKTTVALSKTTVAAFPSKTLLYNAIVTMAF